MYPCKGIAVLNLIPRSLPLSWNTHFLWSAVRKYEQVLQKKRENFLIWDSSEEEVVHLGRLRIKTLQMLGFNFQC